MPKLGAVQFLNFKNDRFDQEGKTSKEATQKACKGGQIRFPTNPGSESVS